MICNVFVVNIMNIFIPIQNDRPKKRNAANARKWIISQQFVKRKESSQAVCGQNLSDSENQGYT